MRWTGCRRKNKAKHRYLFRSDIGGGQQFKQPAEALTGALGQRKPQPIPCAVPVAVVVSGFASAHAARKNIDITRCPAFVAHQHPAGFKEHEGAVIFGVLAGIVQQIFENDYRKFPLGTGRRVRGHGRGQGDR